MFNKRKRTVIFDIEANSLYPSIIWCLVALDINTGEVFKFRPNSPFGGHHEWKDEFLEFYEEVETWIGHNILGYDVFHVNRLLGTNIKVKNCIDTLVLSRLFRPVSPFKEKRKTVADDRIGGHSLDAWGQRLGFPKIVFNAWDKFTEEMLEYCVGDVKLNHEVYKALLIEQEGFSEMSIRLEHMVAWLLARQERNGFYLDQEACRHLLDEATRHLDEMLEKLHEIFPPVPKLVREYDVRYTKDGSMGAVSKRILKEYEECPHRVCEVVEEGKKYNLYVLEEFNPNSSKQKAERLLAIGWEPRKFTPKGNPATDKDSLSDAIDELLNENPDMPQLQYLKDYGIVADRQQKANKWLELVEKDGRVHGKINPIGAGTHRCSHFDDNMANIASVNLDSEGHPLKGLEGKFGYESRACWAASTSDNVIVGADASGIQLRALAHYMNDPDYTRKLLEDDIHVVNQQAAGIDDRPTAKTFIYAWLLGAGDEKTGTIVKVDQSEYEDLFSFAEGRQIWGKEMLTYTIEGVKKKGRKATRKLIATIIKGFKVKEQFLDRTPALKRLKTKDIPEATKQGYLIGLDGRKLWIPNEHLAMSMYLQGFEAVIMKTAMVFYHQELEKQGVEFKQVAYVHDEFQIECHKDDADVVGQAVVDAIKKAGEFYNTNCPLDGEYKVGKNWAMTH